MKSLIALSLMALANISLAISLTASNPKKGVYTAKASDNVSLDLESTKAILMDLENTCEKRCKYVLPNIAEHKVFPSTKENKVYVWTYVKGVKKAKYFMSIVSDKNSIQAKYPSASEVAKLKTQTGLAHAPIFDSLVYSYKLEAEENGTKVTYTFEAKTKDRTVNLLPKVVSKNIRKSIKAAFSNLK